MPCLLQLFFVFFFLVSQRFFFLYGKIVLIYGSIQHNRRVYRARGITPYSFMHHRYLVDAASLIGAVVNMLGDGVRDAMDPKLKK